MRRYALVGLLLLLASLLPSHRPLPAPIAQAATSQPATPGFFGMNAYFTGFERIWNDEEDGIATLLDIGQEAQITWTREEISWGNIERHRKRAREWGIFDDRLRQIADAGYGIVGMVSTTPEWARVADCAARVNRYADQGITTQSYWCPPANVQDYYDIVVRMVERYDGDGMYDAEGSPRVAVWQLWNEPNAWETWPGTPAEFAALHLAGYRAVKEADPTATVVLSGVYVFDGVWDNTWHQDGLHFLNQVFAADPAAWEAFDALAIHPYMPDVAPDAPDLFSKVTLWGRIETTRAWLRARDAQYGYTGGERPIWITEVGWSTCSTLALASEDERARRYRLPTPGGIGLANDNLCKSEREQALYMLRTHALALALGVQHVNYFQLEDKFDGAQLVWGGHSMVDTKLTGYRRKEAFDVYQVMVEQLTGARFEAFGPLHSYTYRANEPFNPAATYHLRLRSDSSLIDLIWTTGDSYETDVELVSGNRQATLVNRLGQQRSLQPDGDGLTVRISDSPVFIQQALPATPTPTASATPTLTTTATLTPTTLTPTTTPTVTPTPAPTLTPVVGRGQVTVSPQQGGILRANEGQPFAEIVIPTRAVSATTRISYTAQVSATALISATGALTAEARYAGRAFDLAVFPAQASAPAAGFRFAQPVSITLSYDAAQITPTLRLPLRLYSWDGTAWQELHGPYQHDAARSRITVATQASGPFVLAQSPPRALVWLPAVRR